MANKLYDYQGFTGWWHGFRDNVREKFLEWREKHPNGLLNFKRDNTNSGNDNNLDFSHIYR